DKHVYFVHATEEVVNVAHDVLVGAGEENAEVVRLVVAEIMQRQCLANVETINVLRHLPVGVARDIDERRFELRPFIEPMNGHDREELAESPVIEQRL